MSKSDKSAAKLTDEQFSLFIRFHTDEPSAEDRQYLRKWQQESNFESAWAEAEDLWDELGFLEPPTLDCTEPVGFRSNWYSLLALAATLLLVIAVGQYWYVSPEGDFYKTDRGERLTVHLSDGSKAFLGPLSELTVNYTKESRHFYLASGEGFFDVISDKARPFIVKTINGTFEAVGTQFNVIVKDGSSELAVVEGVVKVLNVKQDNYIDSTLAVVGDGAVVSLDGRIEIDSDVDVVGITAWTGGQLIFQGEALKDAIEKINLHSKHRIVLRDPSLMDKPLYGVFNIGDSQGFVQALKTAFNIRVVDTSDSTLIVPDGPSIKTL